MAAGKSGMRCKHQRQYSLPMRILAGVHLARLEAIDAQDSGEDEIAEALALMAKRAHVPAKTVVAQSVRRQQTNRFVQGRHGLVAHPNGFLLPNCPDHRFDGLFIDGAPRDVPNLPQALSQ